LVNEIILYYDARSDKTSNLIYDYLTTIYMPDCVSSNDKDDK